MIFIRSHDDDDEDEEEQLRGRADRFAQSSEADSPQDLEKGRVGPAAPTYCVLAWLSCVCCCWAGGLCSLLFSLQAFCNLRCNDSAAAARHGRKARYFAIAALVLGTLTVFVLALVHFLFKRIQLLDNTYLRIYSLFNPNVTATITPSATH